jgi:hypothetical protein
MKDSRVVRKYRLLDRDIALLAHKFYGSWNYEKNPFVLSSGNIRTMQAELDTLKSRVDCIETADPVFSLLRGHFHDFVDSLQTDLNKACEDPGRVVRNFGESFYHAICGDYRPDQVRSEIFLAVIGAFDSIWHEGILPMLSGFDADKLQRLLSGLKHAEELAGCTKEKFRDSLKALPEERIGVLFTETERLIGKLRSVTEEVRKRIEKTGAMPKTGQKADNECLKLDRDEYRSSLKNNVGVNLDELLEWHEAEVEKTRSEALTIANSLKLAECPVKSMRAVSEILFKYAGPCETPEEMFRRADIYLKRAQAAAHEYVWLPEGEICECLHIPEHLKDSYPWGGYASDYNSRYPLYGTMFLNNHNYKAITDGWIKINALHEAYPGHHVQFIRTAIDPLPETVKMGSRHITLTEGMCLRTERAFEFVFPEDPFYPLMVAQRRHHTAVRIKIDLMLYYFNKTIGEACDLYEEELGFDRKTARAQVQAHENTKGYFTSYYYGMKKICEWEKFYGYDKREYTELLFSAGRVSLDTFESILKLSEEDRHSYLHDFGSLLQFS